MEILERKSGGISNSIYSGSFEEVKEWMNKNTIILKNRGIFTDTSNLDCQTKDEFLQKKEIRIHADANVRAMQIEDEGTVYTYSYVNDK